MNSKTFPLEPIEKASIDEMRSLQLKRLQQTLQHAYANSPVYRAKFDAAGVHPDDCKSLADIAKFPFTTKSDLRDSYPFGMFAVPRENCARIHASSGTTGKPTVVGYTLKDIDTWATVVARSIRAGGARPGDMVLSRLRDAEEKIRLAEETREETPDISERYGEKKLSLVETRVDDIFGGWRNRLRNALK